MHSGMIRQGDVLLTPRSKPVPKGATLVPRDAGRVVLAYGEVTGHAHALMEPEVELLELAGERFLRTTAPARLLHEEHTILDIPVLPNGFDVTIQREYTPEAIRNVQD